MVVFPLFSALVSGICALFIAQDAKRTPRPDKVAWAIAFTLFAVAAGAEVVGSLTGWSATLARVYYLSGAVLVVGFLALGELYLLAKPRIEKVAPGVTLLVTAIAATLVFSASVDSARVTEDGWDALERTSALTALTISINSLGTLVIVGGLIYSAVRFRRLGIQRNRTIGCLLIAAGTLVVALGGSLTRLGAHEYLYIAMSIGVTIIFAGYLWTRRPDAVTVPATASTAARPGADLPPATIHRAPVTGGQLATAAPSSNGHTADTPSRAVVFLSELLQRDDAHLSEECRVWSVPVREIDAFTRAEARRVWSVRSRLPEALVPAFDARPPALRLQLAELYAEVLSFDGRAPVAVPLAAAEPASPFASTVREGVERVD